MVVSSMLGVGHGEESDEMEVGRERWTVGFIKQQQAG